MADRTASLQPSQLRRLSMQGLRAISRPLVAGKWLSESHTLAHTCLHCNDIYFNKCKGLCPDQQPLGLCHVCREADMVGGMEGCFLCVRGRVVSKLATRQQIVMTPKGLTDMDIKC